MNWSTAICWDQGKVYTRETHSDDTMEYSDYIYDVIPWVNGEPDHAAVEASCNQAERELD